MENIIYFKPALQTENIGDLLINLVELDLLRKFGKIIIDDSSTPDWFINEISPDKRDLRLSQVSSKPLMKTIGNSLLKNFFSGSKAPKHYLVIQPGHSSRVGSQKAITYFKLNLKFHVLNLLGCRIIRMGFSIGPFDKYNALAESFASRAYSYYAVRDKASLRIAEQYKFKRPQYFPDLAWAYMPKTSVKPEEKYVVVSMRSNAVGKVHNSEYLKPLLKKINKLLQHHISSHKIVVCYQVTYDNEASREIYDELRPAFNTELIDHRLSLSEAEKLYASADYVISNRLHVLLLALKCGTLSFALTDNDDNKKITSLFNDNGLENLILDAKQSDLANMNKIELALKGRVNVMDTFKQNQLNNKSEMEQKLNRLFQS